MQENPRIPPMSEKQKGKQRDMDSASASLDDVDMRDADDELAGLSASRLVGNLSTSSGFLSLDDQSFYENQDMEYDTGELGVVSTLGDGTGPSPWTTDGSESRPDSPREVDDGAPSNEHAPRTPQVGQRRDRQFFSGGSGEKRPKRSRRVSSSVADNDDDELFNSQNESRLAIGAWKRNISLSSHLHSLSVADSQRKPPAASSSVLPPSSRTHQVPVSSTDRDNISNAQPTIRTPSHGKNRAREDSSSPEPPKRNVLESHLKYRPPAQGPRTAPVKLGPPFEHKPAPRSRSKQTQAMSPHQSASVSRPGLPASLPPLDPPSPSLISSPDIPQASPPVLHEEPFDWEGPDDDITDPSRISLTQSLHSRSHRDSSQSSNLHDFHNDPLDISASPPPVQNPSTTIQSAPSHIAPRTASDLPTASSSRHKSSRPTLRNPFPGPHAFCVRREDQERFSPPPTAHKSDNPYKSVAKKYLKPRKG